MHTYLAPAADPDLDGNPLLPGQIATGARIDAAICGHRALRLAVLDDAIRCLLLGLHPRGHAEQRQSREAEAWIRNLDQRWPFSFGNICQALGIDGPRLRERLLAIRYAPALPRTRLQLVRGELLQAG